MRAAALGGVAARAIVKFTAQPRLRLLLARRPWRAFWRSPLISIHFSDCANSP
jgi:hypothetical protein